MSTRGLAMPYQARPPSEVAEEFEATGEPYGVFIDNNLSASCDYLKALCEALRPLGKIWSAAVTSDVGDDPGLTRAMSLSGCVGVFIGFESLSPESLNEASKPRAHPERYATQIQAFHDAGIQVNGSFVFGFDHDRPEVFERTAHWIEESHMECATFHILTPYPGTPLFRKLEAEGRLLHRNWELYDTANAVFQPAQMTPEQLEAGYAWLYRRTFSLPSIWRRRPEQAPMLASYLAMSLLYKKMNLLWPWVIRRRLTRALWRPLVGRALRRHYRWCRRLASPSPSADHSGNLAWSHPWLSNLKLKETYEPS
jgi:radical SAM superfamily enzyme YgiQ (UPF0313 family)